MKSNDVHHQGWDVQVQDKHLKKIICLKLAVHLVIMSLWRSVLMKLSHNGLWGSKLKSSRSNNDQVKHFGLTGAWSIVIKIKRHAQGKVMSLLGFPFTGLKVFVGRPGYRIDSRTIKRGFRMGNLITLSQGAHSFAYFASPYISASWFLLVWGYYDRFYLSNKSKFIENGIQMHLLLRFWVERLYRFFTLEGFTPINIWYFPSWQFLVFLCIKL
jgi:hypothetical protein